MIQSAFGMRLGVSVLESMLLPPVRGDGGVDALGSWSDDEESLPDRR